MNRQNGPAKNAPLKNEKIPKVYDELNASLEELLSFIFKKSKNLASKSLVEALQSYKEYSKGITYHDKIKEIKKYINFPLLKPEPDDVMISYEDPEAMTNTKINNTMLNYLLTLDNFKTVEDRLYVGTILSLVNEKKNKK